MRRGRFRSVSSTAPSRTGGKPPITAGRRRTPSGSSVSAGCTCPLPSMAWSAWTAIWTPRPARPSSPLRCVQHADVRSGDGADMRTSAQRRADALGEICRQWLDGADRPEVAGERPHVTVTVDLEALEGRSGAPCEFDDVGPISPETARRWACDASVSRVITRGRSEPLEVGRRTPVVPAALRRAVAIRDGHCRFPRCGRPHGWCDAHHVRHWADGGETAFPNLILLCRPHHRLVHHGFGVDTVDGRPTFFRPDGSPLEDRAPP